MIVGTKLDAGKARVDLIRLKDETLFPNILGFWEVSCARSTDPAYAPYLRNFESAFHQQLLTTVSTRQLQLIDEEFALLSDLQAAGRSGPFLQKHQYDELCRKHGISEVGAFSRTGLLELFDQLGVVIHFPEIDRLDELLLNPEWLTKGVYTIMFSDDASFAKGAISTSDVERILTGIDPLDENGRKLSYTSAQCKFILDAMEQFRLLYRVPYDRSRLVIPALLDTVQPPVDFNKAEAWAFQFRFEGFMPSHLLPVLIVDRHHEIVDGKVWQYGVHLSAKAHEAEAMVEVDEHTRRFLIWVKGRNANDYLGILRDRVLHSLGRMEHLVYHEEIRLTSDMRIAGSVGRAVGGRPRGETWPSYAQVRDAMRRPGEPFTAPDGARYSVQQFANLVPAQIEVAQLMQLLDECVSSKLESTWQSLAGEFETLKSIISGLEQKSAAEKLKVKSFSEDLLDKIAKAEKAMTLAEKVPQRIRQVYEFIERLVQILT